MINWHKYPFIRLLIPFVIGIWCSFSLSGMLSGEVMKIVFVVAVGLGVVLVVTTCALRSYGLRWVFGFVLNLHLILMGMSIVHIRDDDIDDDVGVFVARLSECPAEKDKTVKVILQMQSDEGAVMAYFEKNERSLGLKYGDVVAFFEPPNIVEPPKNPEQFDYQKYLFRKGILRQVYLRDDAWEKLNENKVNPVYCFSYRLRDFLLRTIRELGIEGEEYSVATAILLGYDDTLPTELREKYVAAGSMHILCVSGMHVGVVFMVFSYMLSFLSKRKRWQNLLKQSLLLLLIWFYAILAGLAPSILRATIMLSFVILSDMVKREGVLLNSLAASAFLLLCIDPANLFNIGFLLSYCAVVGIVVLQKPIYRLFYVKFKILDKIWEMTSVTLAAQIATAPFSIYYFHQFPMYFWLSNLFMTPISSVVITSGIVMLLIFFIPYINVGVAWGVKWMIYVMNYVVTWVENLPMSIIKGLYISDLEFACLLVALLLLMMLVEHREKAMMLGMLSVMLIFSGLQLTRAVMQRGQMIFTVYSLRRATAIDFSCGKEHVMLCDTVVMNDPSVVSFSIDNNLTKEGIFGRGSMISLREEKNFDNSYVKRRENLISFGGKIIAISEEKTLSGVKLPYRTHVDYFIIQGGGKVSLEQILNCYVIDLLIIDGSVPDYLSKKIIMKAEEMGQDFYDVKVRGAFVLRL